MNYPHPFFFSGKRKKNPKEKALRDKLFVLYYVIADCNSPLSLFRWSSMVNVSECADSFSMEKFFMAGHPPAKPSSHSSLCVCVRVRACVCVYVRSCGTCHYRHYKLLSLSLSLWYASIVATWTHARFNKDVAYRSAEHRQHE